jgi:rhamnogalacturonyl hydrolase YesR
MGGVREKARENFWHEIFMCKSTQREKINESSSSFFCDYAFLVEIPKGRVREREKEVKRKREESLKKLIYFKTL